VNRRGIAAGFAGLALAATTLTGCWNGYQAQTTAQTQGGEVASANVGDVQARGLIWVRAPDNAYFSGTMLIAPAGQPDELVSITAEPGGDAGLTGSPVPVTEQEPARVGFNGQNFATVSGVPNSPSPFLNTTLTFANAGSVSVSVLVVPAEGAYADVVKQSKKGLESAGDATETGGESSATPAPAAG
jgi:hypothetical protein